MGVADTEVRWKGRILVVVFNNDPFPVGVSACVCPGLLTLGVFKLVVVLVSDTLVLQVEMFPRGLVEEGVLSCLTASHTSRRAGGSGTTLPTASSTSMASSSLLSAVSAAGAAAGGTSAGLSPPAGQMVGLGPFLGLLDPRGVFEALGGADFLLFLASCTDFVFETTDAGSCARLPSSCWTTVKSNGFDWSIFVNRSLGLILTE